MPDQTSKSETRWYTLVPLRRMAITIFVVATLAASAGLCRLSFNDNPRDLYSRDDADTAELDAIQSLFGTDDRGLAVVITGDELITHDALRRQLDFVDALRQHSLISEVRSLFDARHVVRLGSRAIPLPLVPYEPRADDDYVALRDDLLEHPLIEGRLLSDDSKTAVVVCRIEESAALPAAMAGAIDQVRSIAGEVFRHSNLRARITGPAALRIDTFYRLKRDLAVSCSLGGGVILAIAWLFFRRLQPVAIALLCPAIGVIWTLGLMGWFGQRLDGLNCLLPTLLFAIGFTDAMYLITAITRRRRCGSSDREAAKEGFAEVWKACLLTSITTAIGFLALTSTTIGSLQRFGLGAAIGVVCVFAGVLLAAPLLTTLPWFRDLGQQRQRTRPGKHAMRLGMWATTHPVLISFGSLMLFAALALASRQVPFDMRWSEALETGGETVSTAHHLDRTFGGSVPAQIAIQWPSKANSEEIFGYLRSLHERLETYTEDHQGAGFRLGRPFSLLSVVEGLPGVADSLPARIRLVERYSPDLFKSFICRDKRALLVTIPLPDIGAKRLLPVFEKIDQELRRLATQHTGFSARLTGTTVVSARNLTEVLHELVRGLSFAAVLAFAILWIGFRSLRLALLSILPNSMPLLVALFALLVTGQPMQVTVALTLCLSLGLAADDTIHFITGFRSACAEGRSAKSSCLRAYRAVGSAMVISTLVLVAAMATTLLSNSPAIRLFGWLSSVTLIAALLGDLLILPSMLSLNDVRPAKPLSPERTRHALRTRNSTLAGALSP